MFPIFKLFVHFSVRTQSPLSILVPCSVGCIEYEAITLKLNREKYNMNEKPMIAKKRSINRKSFRFEN